MRRPPAPVSTSRALRAPGVLGLIVTANVAVSPAASVIGPPVVIANAPSASPTIVACAIVIGSVRMFVIMIGRVACVPSVTVPNSIWLTDAVIHVAPGAGSAGGVVVPLPVSVVPVPAGGVVVDPEPVFDGGVVVLPPVLPVEPPLFVPPFVEPPVFVPPLVEPPVFVVPPDDVSGGVVVVVCVASCRPAWWWSCCRSNRRSAGSSRRPRA